MPWANIGAGWKNVDKNTGKEWTSWQLEPDKIPLVGGKFPQKVKFSIFPNDRKTQPNHPDFNLAMKVDEYPERDFDNETESNDENIPF